MSKIRDYVYYWDGPAPSVWSGDLPFDYGENYYQVPGLHINSPVNCDVSVLGDLPSIGLSNCIDGQNSPNSDYFTDMSYWTNGLDSYKFDYGNHYLCMWDYSGKETNLQPNKWGSLKAIRLDYNEIYYSGWYDESQQDAPNPPHFPAGDASNDVFLGLSMYFDCHTHRGTAGVSYNTKGCGEIQYFYDAYGTDNSGYRHCDNWCKSRWGENASSPIVLNATWDGGDPYTQDLTLFKAEMGSLYNYGSWFRNTEHGSSQQWRWGGGRVDYSASIINNYGHSNTDGYSTFWETGNTEVLGGEGYFGLDGKYTSAAETDNPTELHIPDNWGAGSSGNWFGVNSFNTYLFHRTQCLCQIPKDVKLRHGNDLFGPGTWIDSSPKTVCNMTSDTCGCLNAKAPNFGRNYLGEIQSSYPHYPFKMHNPSACAPEYHPDKMGVHYEGVDDCKADGCEGACISVSDSKVTTWFGYANQPDPPIRAYCAKETVYYNPSYTIFDSAGESMGNFQAHYPVGMDEIGCNYNSLNFEDNVCCNDPDADNYNPNTHYNGFYLFAENTMELNQVEVDGMLYNLGYDKCIYAGGAVEWLGDGDHNITIPRDGEWHEYNLPKCRAIFDSVSYNFVDYPEKFVFGFSPGPNWMEGLGAFSDYPNNEYNALYEFAYNTTTGTGGTNYWTWGNIALHCNSEDDWLSGSSCGNSSLALTWNQDQFDVEFSQAPSFDGIARIRTKQEGIQGGDFSETSSFYYNCHFFPLDAHPILYTLSQFLSSDNKRVNVDIINPEAQEPESLPIPFDFGLVYNEGTAINSDGVNFYMPWVYTAGDADNDGTADIFDPDLWPRIPPSQTSPDGQVHTMPRRFLVKFDIDSDDASWVWNGYDIGGNPPISLGGSSGGNPACWPSAGACTGWSCTPEEWEDFLCYENCQADEICGLNSYTHLAGYQYQSLSLPENVCGEWNIPYKVHSPHGECYEYGDNGINNNNFDPYSGAEAESIASFNQSNILVGFPTMNLKVNCASDTAECSDGSTNFAPEDGSADFDISSLCVDPEINACVCADGTGQECNPINTSLTDWPGIDGDWVSSFNSCSDCNFMREYECKSDGICNNCVWDTSVDSEMTYHLDNTTYPMYGTATINGSIITYTPSADFSSYDYIEYYATGNNGLTSNVAQFAISVVGVDDPPVTLAVSTQTMVEDHVLDIVLSCEDIDSFQGASFDINDNAGVGTDPPNNGTVELLDDLLRVQNAWPTPDLWTQTARYTPNQDWFGTDSFSFVCSTYDDAVYGTPVYGYIRTVTIDVQPHNDAPYAYDIDDIVVNENETVMISYNCFDVEGDDLDYEAVTNPSYGTLDTQAGTVDNQWVLYTPMQGFTGQDSFTYYCYSSDDDGSVQHSGNATVTINVLPSNPPRLLSGFDHLQEITPIIDEAIEIPLICGPGTYNPTHYVIYYDDNGGALSDMTGTLSVRDLNGTEISLAEGEKLHVNPTSGNPNYFSDSFVGMTPPSQKNWYQVPTNITLDQDISAFASEEIQFDCSIYDENAELCAQNEAYGCMFLSDAVTGNTVCQGGPTNLYPFLTLIYKPRNFFYRTETIYYSCLSDTYDLGTPTSGGFVPALMPFWTLTNYSCEGLGSGCIESPGYTLLDSWVSFSKSLYITNYLFEFYSGENGSHGWNIWGDNDPMLYDAPPEGGSTKPQVAGIKILNEYKEQDEGFGIPDVEIRPSLDEKFDPLSGIDMQISSQNFCSHMEFMRLPTIGGTLNDGKYRRIYDYNPTGWDQWDSCTNTFVSLSGFSRARVVCKDGSKWLVGCSDAACLPDATTTEIAGGDWAYFNFYTGVGNINGAFTNGEEACKLITESNLQNTWINTREYFDTDNDKRPSLGLFYYEEDNQLSNNFLPSISEFNKYTINNLIGNSSGRGVAEIFGYNSTYPNLWMSPSDSELGTTYGYKFYSPKIDSSGWDDDVSEQSYANDYRDILYGLDWRKDDGEYCIGGTNLCRGAFLPTGIDVYDDPADGSHYTHPFPGFGWGYMNYDGMVTAAPDASNFPYYSDTYQPDTEASLYAGYFMSFPIWNNSHYYNVYSTTELGSNDKMLLPWAQWTYSPECHSYGRCLAFASHQDGHFFEYNSEGIAKHKRKYTTLNQIQKIYDASENMDAESEILPYSSLKVTFWMKTTRWSYNPLGSINNKPIVEVAVTGDAFHPARQSRGNRNWNNEQTYTPYGDNNSQDKKIYGEDGNILVDWEWPLETYSGGAARFSSSELNKWEKFSYTFRLSNGHLDSEGKVYDLYFQIMRGDEAPATIYLDDFEVTEAYNFSPDVDVRTKKGSNDYSYASLTEYYDPYAIQTLTSGTTFKFQELPYYETVAPLEAQFYFYPRYHYNDPFNFAVNQNEPIKQIIHNDFRRGLFYLYDVDWGDNSPKEFVNEPLKLGNNTVVNHTYEKSGIFEITGYMLRMKSDRNFNPIGVAHNERFTLRINVNEGLDEDFTFFNSEGFSFIPYKNTTPVIGGYTEESIYYKSIKRQLGYISDDLLEKVDTTFNKVSDELKTESALLKMTEYFKDSYNVLPNFENEIIVQNQLSTDEIWTGKLYSGHIEELGNSIGDADITNVKYFNKPIGMYEMLGFQTEDIETNIPNNKRYWKNIIPEDTLFSDRNGITINEDNTFNIDITSEQEWFGTMFADCTHTYHWNEGTYGGPDGIQAIYWSQDDGVTWTASGHQCNHESSDISQGQIDQDKVTTYKVECELSSGSTEEVMFIDNNVPIYSSANTACDSLEYGYYYPVLPKYDKFGKYKFDDEYPESYDYPFNNIVFPENGMITDENLNYSDDSLRIYLDSSKVELNVFGDKSGNQNYGFSFSDYKVEFDNQTAEPKRIKNTKELRKSKSNGAF